MRVCHQRRMSRLDNETPTDYGLFLIINVGSRQTDIARGF